MYRLKVVILVVSILMSALGCAHRIEPYDPFKIDAQGFCSKVKTIALVPVRIPNGVLEPETVKEQFEAAIKERLSRVGFYVLPSKAYRETEEKIARETGGYFDVKTGDLNEEKYKSVQDQTRKTLHATHRAEAFLYGTVRVVKVSFYGAMVSWHGTRENISKTGKRSEADKTGSVGALSLGLWIEDQEGKDLYDNWGGIQLLSKLEDKGKIFRNVKFISIPEEDILSDKARNENAVGIALGPLLYQKKKPLLESAEPTKAPAEKKP
jgi:hypothetical protein